MFNLRNLAPATLKKYGIYAILSLSLSLNMYFISNTREDMKSEKAERQQLQNLLIQQETLKKEQTLILKQNVLTNNKN